MPVLAAAKNPPVNTTAGTPYNHEYSGGSVGPVVLKLYLQVLPGDSVRTSEHVQHALGDDKATSHVDTGEKYRESSKSLRNSSREITAPHYEEAANADHTYRTTINNILDKNPLTDLILH
jgi:hypothetical protein